MGYTESMSRGRQVGGDQLMSVESEMSDRFVADSADVCDGTQPASRKVLLGSELPRCALRLKNSSD